MASNNATKDAELNGEPSLDELFDEPIVQLIMRRDGVDAANMRGEINRLVPMYATA